MCGCQRLVGCVCVCVSKACRVCGVKGLLSVWCRRLVECGVEGL